MLEVKGRCGPFFTAFPGHQRVLRYCELRTTRQILLQRRDARGCELQAAQRSGVAAGNIPPEVVHAFELHVEVEHSQPNRIAFIIEPGMIVVCGRKLFLGILRQLPPKRYLVTHARASSYLIRCGFERRLVETPISLIRRKSAEVNRDSEVAQRRGQIEVASDGREV
jgi:hypothetical protein